VKILFCWIDICGSMAARSRVDLAVLADD